MNDALYAHLQALRRHAMALVASVPDGDRRRMHHKDLSPLLWHLGHLLYIERYWVGERLAGRPADRERARLFRPDGLRKSERGRRVPDLDALAAQWRAWDGECRALLATPPGRAPTLLRDHYVLRFLIQHHGQHLETMRQVLCARHLRAPSPPFPIPTPLQPQALAPPARVHPAGAIRIGAESGPEAYDNERPAHALTVPAFAIAARPVSNAAYLGFMEAGGYKRPALWSREGWQWRKQARARGPWHWRQNPEGAWYAVGPDGPEPLIAEEPVAGINFYEAQALARFAHARLPSEPEWEAAARRGLLEDTGLAWEWCGNHFYPYPGFRAFPYRGYSMPWFDGAHVSLRGGSRYSDDAIRRATFRNFHSPAKRHIFSGVRLCRSLP